MKNYKNAALTLVLVLTASTGFALARASIYKDDALEIVKAMEKLNIAGIPWGSDDTGATDIKVYRLFGMRCDSGYSNYGGYGSERQAGCHFKGVQSAADLKKIRTILATGGLSRSNPVFK